MKYEFTVCPMQEEQDMFWVAKSKALEGCIGEGDTAEEAVKELEENEDEWLLTAKEHGFPIPAIEPKRFKSYSGKLSLRISPFEHEKASRNAEELDISLNQYLSDAVASYNAKYEEARKKHPAQNP